MNMSQDPQGRAFPLSAFVCYTSPDVAAQARARFHGMPIGDKTLIVTNYELPEIRKKQQERERDSANFYSQRNTVEAG